MGSGYYPIEWGNEDYDRIMNALNELKEIAEAMAEIIYENDQTDNAVSDGMYQNDFRKGINLIESCLLHSKEERLIKAKDLAKITNEKIEYLEMEILRQNNFPAWCELMAKKYEFDTTNQLELQKIVDGYGNWNKIDAARYFLEKIKEANHE